MKTWEELNIHERFVLFVFFTNSLLIGRNVISETNFEEVFLPPREMIDIAIEELVLMGYLRHNIDSTFYSLTEEGYEVIPRPLISGIAPKTRNSNRKKRVSSPKNQL